MLPLLAAAVLVACVRLDAASPGRRARTGHRRRGRLALCAPRSRASRSCATVVLLWDARQRVGWALAGVALFWSLDGLSQSYLAFAIRPDRALALANLSLWVFNRLGSLLPLTLAVLLAVFPTGRLVAGAWGVATRLALGAMVAASLLVMVTPMPEKVTGVALPPGVDVDLATLPMPSVMSHVATPVDVVVSVAGALVAMASVVVRYRRSTGRDRDRLRWLLWAVVAMAVLLVLSLAAGGSRIQGTAAVPGRPAARRSDDDRGGRPGPGSDRGPPRPHGRSTARSPSWSSASTWGCSRRSPASSGAPWTSARPSSSSSCSPPSSTGRSASG